MASKVRSRSPTTGWWTFLVPVRCTRTSWDGPQGAEQVAAGGELADQVGEDPVVGRAAGLGAQQGDDLAGVALPVPVEGLGAGVEEGEPGGVHRAVAAARTSRRTSAAPSRFVATASRRPFWTNTGTSRMASISCCTFGRTCCGAGRAAATAGVGALVRSPDQVVEVGVLGLVELQGPADAVEDGLGDAGRRCRVRAGRSTRCSSRRAGRPLRGAAPSRGGGRRSRAGPPAAG